MTSSRRQRQSQPECNSFEKRGWYRVEGANKLYSSSSSTAYSDAKRCRVKRSCAKKAFFFLCKNVESRLFTNNKQTGGRS